jgi:hypothetical protein
MIQNAVNIDSHGPRVAKGQWVPCTSGRPEWNVEEAYTRYLHGASLRKLERIYGIKFYKIYRMLLKEKGPKACEVQNVSLVRSVLKDQKVHIDTLDGYDRYLGGTQTHRPGRTMNNLSKYKTVFDPEDTESQAYQGPSPWDYAEAMESGRPGPVQTWRLPLYTTVVGLVATLLEAMVEDLARRATE